MPKKHTPVQTASTAVELLLVSASLLLHQTASACTRKKKKKKKSEIDIPISTRQTLSSLL